MQTKISQSILDKTPSPDKGKTIQFADTELRGFYLIITPTKRSFYVQSLVNGKQVRAKFGDAPAMNAKDARAKARQILVEMRDGTNPNEERRKAKAKGITLREALNLHLSAKSLSAKTRHNYTYNMEQYLPDWLDKPLADIGTDRTGVRLRHGKITKQHGATTADSCYRVLRALYNRGLREHPDLPSNPTNNVDYHGLKRRKVDANSEKLKAWGEAVLKLNPIRRDMHLFIILTGMRRTSAIEARIDQVLPGALHVPKPKGGSARAFDLPLSEPLQALINHRIEQNAIYFRKTPWLFPSESKTGHVAEVQQWELGDLTGHALRHTYATLAQESGVPLAELKFLLNHATNNVTMGYLNPSLDYLRSLQEKASAKILDALGLEYTGTWPLTLKE